MAELVVTQDELALRRRARRRLVGAVAIALTVVVALPMLFDSEPKPLGPEVDIRIPAQDSPFEAGTGAVSANPTVPAAPEPLPAEPTLPSIPAVPPPGTVTAPVVEPATSAKTPLPVVAPAPEKAKPEVKPEAKTVPKPETKPEAKSEAKSQNIPDAKPAAKPSLKPDSSFSSQGYFLQLGAFTSESNARHLQEKATAAGFKAVQLGSNGQFRVRVGPIPQHERALEMQAKLKAKGFSPVLLGP
jgi:DedD protein